MSRFSFFSLSALLISLAVSSCVHQENPELIAAREELTVLQTEQANQVYQPGSYEYFVCHNNYPVTLEIYKNAELMAKANKHSRVIICLEQQRGRLYVGNEVAADWPVSTGIRGRETPVGNYTVLEKKENYSSNRYGKMYNEKGKCINSDADCFTQAVPEGGRFAGSPMPYWMRLTWDGVGMHIGKVAAGKPLSHGCIRTPRAMAIDLYKIVGIGTKVSVIKDLESWYPGRMAMELGKTISAREKRIYELQKKIYDIQMQEIAARGR